MIRGLVGAILIATAIAILSLSERKHRPQPALPLVSTDYERCIRINPGPLAPPKGRHINNGPRVVDVA